MISHPKSLWNGCCVSWDGKEPRHQSDSASADRGADRKNAHVGRVTQLVLDKNNVFSLLVLQTNPEGMVQRTDLEQTLLTPIRHSKLRCPKKILLNKEIGSKMLW